MSLTTLKTKVGQGGAVRRIYRLAPLPHHPTPKGVVGVVWQIGAAQSVFRGRADFSRVFQPKLCGKSELPNFLTPKKGIRNDP